MSITKPPSDWHFYVALPDPQDTREINREWTVEIKNTLSYAGQEFTFREPVSIWVEGYWTKPHFFLQIGITGKAEVPCSRCLELTEVAIKGQFSYLYGLASEIEGKDDKSADDESLVSINSWKSVLDIKDQVWECLILLLPEKVLCKEGCKGLCPVCGANLNLTDCNCRQEEIDPRLSVLRDISKESGESDQ